jgi:hypothetical protein
MGKRTHLAVVGSADWLEDSLTSIGIVDQWIPLRSMNKLEMLSTITSEDGFLGRHLDRGRIQRRI